MRSPYDDPHFRKLMRRTAESLDGSLECLKESDELLRTLGAYNTDLIRWICRHVDGETDPTKADELLQLLKAVIQNDLEDVHIRMEHIRKKYALVFKQSTDADWLGNDHD